MHGNDIQECDEHDKRNTAESPCTRALTSAGFSFASAPKMVLHHGITISYLALKRGM